MFIAIIEPLISLVILGGIVYAIVAAVRRSRSDHSSDFRGKDESLPGGADRIFTYALSFAGLMAVLFGLTTVLALAFIPFVPDSNSVISADEVRTRLSYSLASLIVGTPLWFFLWRRAQARLRNPSERNAASRRLYLAGIFATTAIVALFGAMQALNASVLMLGNGSNAARIQDLITGGSLFGVYGVAWLWYARIRRHERSAKADDWTHDAAIYVVTGTALVAAAFGMADLLQDLIRHLQGSSSALAAGDRWSDWSGALTTIVAAGAVWIALQMYDKARGGARILRLIYLYLALALFAPVAVYNAGAVLYELVRRGFGYGGGDVTWSFIADDLPWLVIASVFWVYHWIQVRDQEALQASGGPRERPAGSMRYGRRPVLAVYTAAGTVLMAAGVAIAMWTGIDALLKVQDVVPGGEWWRDQISVSITLLVVGICLWAPAWSLLQRAVSVDPSVERASTARRWLLAILTVGGALVGLGFGVALLFEVLRAALGQTDSNSLRNALHFGGSTLLALAIAGYYWSISRLESKERVRARVSRRVRLALLLAPGADAAMQEVLPVAGFDTEIIGYVSADCLSGASDLATLRTALGRLVAEEQSDRALLILGADGGSLYPYTRSLTEGVALSVSGVR